MIESNASGFDWYDNTEALSSTYLVPASFNFQGLISDIVMSRGHIYCIKDTSVYLFDMNGQVLSEASCGFGASRLAVLSGDEVAVISGSEIARLEISEKG